MGGLIGVLHRFWLDESGEIITLTVAAFKAMTVASQIAAVATVLSTAGALKQGADAKKLGRYQSDLADKRALEEQAAGIKKSQNERLSMEMMMSRARAVGAASGGGIDLDLMGKLAEEGALRSGMAIWQGNQRATDTRAQGAEALFTGESKRRASVIKAGSTLLGGHFSLLDNYGTGDPK